MRKNVIALVHCYMAVIPQLISIGKDERSNWNIPLRTLIQISRNNLSPQGKHKEPAENVKHILNIITIIDSRQNNHSNTPFQILLF